MRFGIDLLLHNAARNVQGKLGNIVFQLSGSLAAFALDLGVRLALERGRLGARRAHKLLAARIGACRGAFHDLRRLFLCAGKACLVFLFHCLCVALGLFSLGVGRFDLLFTLGKDLLHGLEQKMLHARRQDKQVADLENERPRGEGDEVLKLFHSVSSFWRRGLNARRRCPRLTAGP